MATKLIETSLHQGLLNEMFKNPDIVDAMLIDEAGYVKAIIDHVDGPKTFELGRIGREYERYFGTSKILSWKVTGGYPLNGNSQIDNNGVEFTPMAYHGLNIEFSTK